MRNKWLLYLVLFMLAVNAALVSTMLFNNKALSRECVEKRPKHKFRNPGTPNHKFQDCLINELGLDESQQEKLIGFSETFHNQQKDYRQRIFELRKDYFNAFSQANPDTLALRKIASEIGEIETQRMNLEHIHYRNIRSVCNNEQAIKMDSLGHMQMKQRFRNKNPEGQCRQLPPKE